MSTCHAKINVEYFLFESISLQPTNSPNSKFVRLPDNQLLYSIHLLLPEKYYAFDRNQPRNINKNYLHSLTVI